jgi:hypothetical protein
MARPDALSKIDSVSGRKSSPTVSPVRNDLLLGERALSAP